MSRQIQIRRGSTTEHENFTGVIGEVTMDTDKKTLRVHDGSTVGGIALARVDQIPETSELPETYDFVIETGSNSNGWYRKYKSGWIEQGGISLNGVSSYQTVINLPVEMSDINYHINTTASIQSTYFNSSDSVSVRSAMALAGTVQSDGITTTSFIVSQYTSNRPVRWEVKGFSV
ncbi:MAG: hypothetical protein JW974_01275 [Alphaproteobacteria bacterium]|nr:hypothetical protein [Alphaproteobacteria bacterium]MBN2675417.1 hypothetical protein [Alphaproteobacteria bacterium]